MINRKINNSKIMSLSRTKKEKKEGRKNRYNDFFPLKFLCIGMKLKFALTKDISSKRMRDIKKIIILGAD